MTQHYIIPLTQHRLPASIGAKARNLRTLMDKGYKVPDSYICTWDAYQSYLHDDVRLLDQLIAELSIVVNPEINYAIRSSANVEDSENYSFAGQFKSMLDIRGTNPVLQAIWAVWATAQSTEVRSYLGESSQGQSAIKMAVIIQEMIRPEISGVSFSKNPITCLDEIVVEAVMGRGDLLMKQGITPHRWVNKWGSWLCKPDLDDFPAGLLEEIVDRTRQIFKKPSQRCRSGMGI